MKRALLLTVTCFMLYALPLFGQTDTVTILHLNDTHGNLATIGPRDSSLVGSLGGIARAATLIGMERMADPKALLLHAGDVSIGDLFYNKYFGVAELRLLVALGCDAMAVGNHEFDLTPSTFLTALDSGFVGGGFPLLSANLVLDDPAVQPLKNYVDPYTIKQVGNVRVGIFGLTTSATNLISQPAPAVVDANFVPIAAAMVDTLASHGCSVIICLSHLGLGYDKQVAEDVPGIHVIVGGHDHFALEHPEVVQNPLGDTTWIVQANAFYLDLGKLRLTVNGGKVRLLDYVLEPIDKNIPEEPTVAANVSAMIADIESVYGPVYSAKIAEVDSFFQEVADSLMVYGRRDTPIGNLVTDAFRAVTGTQIAIEVGGSTAEPLYAGPIVAADAFRAVGYGFNTVNGLGYRIVTLEMMGAALKAGLEFGVSTIEQDDEYLIQVSGMKYRYDHEESPGSRIHTVSVGGNPIDLSATYTVAANEFVPLFLDMMQIPYANLHVCGDTTEFSALAGYVAQLGRIAPVREGRVVDARFTGINSPSKGEALPGSFELHQNYPNPFNPNTTIGFELPKASFVTVKVYNVLGQEVATLVNEMKNAGSHRIAWNAGSMASGVYFYSIQAGSFRQTKSMLLLK